MHKIETGVNNEQFARIKEFAKLNKISIWRLMKKALLEKVNNKTLDEFK